MRCDVVHNSIKPIPKEIQSFVSLHGIMNASMLSHETLCQWCCYLTIHVWLGKRLSSQLKGAESLKEEQGRTKVLDPDLSGDVMFILGQRNQRSTAGERTLATNQLQWPAQHLSHALKSQTQRNHVD